MYLINIPISDDLNIIATSGLLEESNILDFEHLKEYKKLPKDLKKNQQHWIETCNKLVR